MSDDKEVIATLRKRIANNKSKIRRREDTMVLMRAEMARMREAIAWDTHDIINRGGKVRFPYER